MQLASVEAREAVVQRRRSGAGTEEVVMQEATVRPLRCAAHDRARPPAFRAAQPPPRPRRGAASPRKAWASNVSAPRARPRPRAARTGGRHAAADGRRTAGRRAAQQRQPQVAALGEAGGGGGGRGGGGGGV